MSNGYVIPIDPHELANRFASHDEPLDGEGIPEEDDSSLADQDPNSVEGFLLRADYETRVAPLLARIPPREADLIEMYFVRRKRQADIAQIFGVTQAAISYRLDRGVQRIKFLLSIPQVTQDELEEDLAEIFDGTDVGILIGMWRSTCQSVVAKELNLTQGRVRHRFFKAVDTLRKAKEEDAKFEPYWKIFSMISDKNFNVLREVLLPQWSDRGGDICQ